MESSEHTLQPNVNALTKTAGSISTLINILIICSLVFIMDSLIRLRSFLALGQYPLGDKKVKVFQD